MSKIKSLEELKKIRERAYENTNLRTTGENNDRIVLAVGMATCGIAAGARETMSTFMEEVDKNKLENISVIATGCFGMCYAEPLVEVRMPGKEPVRYGKVDGKRAKEIIEKHIMKGTILEEAIVLKEGAKQ